MSKHGQKDFSDDDGRTVADMSGLQSQPMFLPRLPKKRKNKMPENKDGLFLTKKEKAAYIFGTLKSALLIGTVFAVAYALLILLMILIRKL